MLHVLSKGGDEGNQKSLRVKPKLLLQYETENFVRGQNI